MLLFFGLPTALTVRKSASCHPQAHSCKPLLGMKLLTNQFSSALAKNLSDPVLGQVKYVERQFDRKTELHEPVLDDVHIFRRRVVVVPYREKSR